MDPIELDARGLDCPLPLLKAKQALNRLPSGSRLRVEATDPGSERDFAAYAAQAGHRLLQSDRHGDVFVFVIEKC